ncbi:MAG: DNA polymerase III subunit alpha [candidate division KSB1 bacterium]|nr:DNA polymerase III subunit alpha [candidate division KSB1 bacterium]MDZ7394049.1 DNA polymerase III subunit alpha [candidate division KSB1 bacterium]
MFVHLHTHSYYSFLAGVDSIEALCAAAARQGMPALALTDTNGLYGLIWFVREAQDHGVRPIVGAEVTTGQHQAVLLVKDAQGYRRLCHILSARHLQEDFSLSGQLIADREGLVVLSHSLPLLEQVARHSGTADLYVELAPGQAIAPLVSFAKQHGIPLVATNDVHFVEPEGYGIHRLLRAIALNTSLSRLSPVLCAHPQAWFKSRAQMAALFPNLPEAIANTRRIAEQCTFVPHASGCIFPNPHGEAAFQRLRQLSYEGAAWRYGTITEPVRARLEHELAIIQQKGFADYFLVVHDIVRQSPRTCGRGSGAASLVAYCLGITHVDPLRHNLFFERFLNVGRKDPPDIDVDFAWDERDEVLDYVFRTYGEARAAMVANHVCFKARAALHEIAKVYGLPEEEITRVTKKFSRLWFAGDFVELMGAHPLFRGQELPPPWPEIIALARRLHGVPKQLSVHCGGVVIVPDCIDNYVPRQRAAKGVTIIQWEKDQTEEAGLVKIDLLGNRSLAVIRDALQAIRQNYGVAIRYQDWNPIDDPKTQELIKNGDTVGVFYVESPAMRQLQKKAQTGDFEHLVIHSSIIRPAANVFIQAYLARLKGAPYKPLHPLLADILKETYGIMVYQEDVAKTAMALADFDPAEADELRKILSKKHRHKRLADLKAKFYRGALAKGVERRTIDAVWQMIMSFEGYSFCKPHSASYALVSFKSAYLRAHYPAEFMAAVISNQGGYYSTFAYVSEARRMGLKVLLPDINSSERAYTGKGRELRVGLMQIKGLAEESIAAILAARARGPFRSLDDFLQRVHIDLAQVRLLIKAGAFDSVEPHASRPELMWRLQYWAHAKRRCAAQVMWLFDEDTPAIPHIPDYDERTVLRHEMETLGFLISRHPLTLYQERLQRLDYVLAKDLPRYAGRTVTTIGWWVTGKVVSTKRDEPMEFMSFEDTTALYETVFFPQAYAKFARIISDTRPYVLRGRVQEEYGAVTLNVFDVRFL